jgi:iron complex outermembrane receptor protein
MDATYRESLRTVRNSALATVTAGNTMPGVPKTRAFLDASWRSTGWTQKPGGKFSEAGLEFVATGDMQANSVNSEKASSYELFNARLATHIQNGGHRLSLYARVDNLLDKRYVGSVVADQAFLRFYEPGAPRSWLMGIRYTLQM